MIQLKDYHLWGTFPKGSYKKELVYEKWETHEKLPIKHFLLQQESKQKKASLKNCLYLWLLPN